MRRYGGLSRDVELSSPRQFFLDCTIAMCGYDFREGHSREARAVHALRRSQVAHRVRLRAAERCSGGTHDYLFTEK